MQSLRTLPLTHFILRLTSFVVAVACSIGNCQDADETDLGSSRDFAQSIAPFLAKHCVKCHGAKEPEGGLSLAAYTDSAKVQTDYAVWEKVQRLLIERQMPPADSARPPEGELQGVIAAIDFELSQFDCQGVTRPGRVTLRRLNRVEYNNTIRDLVGIDFRPADDFPSDDVGNGFDNIGDVLTLSPILFEKYLAAAESIVTRAFDTSDTSRAASPARRRLLAHQADAKTTQRDATRRNLIDFAERAFRRPVNDTELARLVELVRVGRQQGLDEIESIKIAFQAILTSPHFLFRIEQDPASEGDVLSDENGMRHLNDYELATRMSYFLWSSMPDDELFRLAREKKLSRPEILEAQTRRMLKDPKAEALTKNFAGQWLQLRSLADITPDPQMFPSFDDELRASMRRETELLFESIVQDNRSVLDFLNADFTFVDERLAKHYQIADIVGDEFRRVPLPSNRRGILTQASILMLTSNPTRTSPVKRGKWILDNILGEPPPPPPEGVSELSEDAESLGSLRERMEQHRANEACAVCHRKMDAIGFGMENFDVTGAWRDKDGRFEIEPAGVLPGGQNFKNAPQLITILVDEKREQFCRCLAEKMLTYAIGRGLQSFDRCAIDRIVKRLEDEEYRLGSLVSAIVTSDPFTMRELRKDR